MNIAGMGRLFAFTTLVIAFGVTDMALARDFYVAPSGNDRNGGSLDRPVRSIARGLTLAAKPGDRVVLREGVYRPTRTINIMRPGSPTRPITVKAFDGETAVVDGSETPADANLIAVGTSHVRIEGLTVRNANGTGIAVWGLGQRVHHVAVVDCTVHHCRESGIYAGFNSLSDPVRGIEFIGNTVHHASLKNDGRTARNSWAYSIGAGLSKDVSIRDNHVSFGYGEGIGLYLSDGGVIANNVVHDCYSVNVYLDHATHSRVEANHVYSMGDERFFRFQQPASGIQIANENYGRLANPCSHNVIVNNVLVGNSINFNVASYQAGGGFRHSLFAHNTCYGATNRVLNIDFDKGHADSRIVNNIFCQTGVRPLVNIKGPIAEIEFRSNLWDGGFVPSEARDADDVVADPLLSDGRIDDALSFRLPRRSPGTNVATRFSQVDKDFAGRERQQMTSLGAFD